MPSVIELFIGGQAWARGREGPDASLRATGAPGLRVISD